MVHFGPLTVWTFYLLGRCSMITQIFNEFTKFDKIPSFKDISKVWNHKLLGDYKGLQSEGFVKKKTDS